MPCTMASLLIPSDPLFHHALQILQIVTDGAAARLNCSACPRTVPWSSCMGAGNVEPSCKAYFESIPCGQNKTIADNRYLCDLCVGKYRANGTAVCHSKAGLLSMCPTSVPLPKASPQMACNWSLIV
jgi:hypothetical protein